MLNYVIASSKDWFDKHLKTSEFNSLNIIKISSREQLNLEFLEKINPRYIFFPHWNWRVNSEIYERFDCVVFHTAPLPYGRGGSPIQNLIIRDIKNAPVCALKMTETLDGGPIYDSIEISLDGTISDIFTRIAVCVEQLIVKICLNNLTPVNQVGKPLYFNRLSYSDNEIKHEYSIKQIYDRIRMVDGECYKRAYINFGDYKIEFTESKFKNNQIIAKARFYYNES
jgi:methionyl-tRNA formyltransferase